MTSAPLSAIAEHLDELLRIREIEDYPNAVNGVQVENGGSITHVAAAVDASRIAIERAVEIGADLLLVHHGMFWSGLQPVRGLLYDRLKLLLDHGIAVYSAHLPLDAHPELGNNVLLARDLQLDPRGGFATFRGTAIGVHGDGPIDTGVLIERARDFAQRHGGTVRTTPVRVGQTTRRWAICTGGGASADTLAEAVATGIDTLIVGEGPHWTAVEAADAGLTIVYAGHYATETPGVRALAERIARTFRLRWSVIEAPTGL